MSAKYCLDTSVFIEGWHRVWPPDLVPEFWDRLAELIDTGLAVAPRAVLEDLSHKDDDIYAWVRERDSKAFIAETPEVQASLKEILATFERLVDTRKGRNASDPWVIAVARVYGLIVVTQEVNPGTPRRPTIPFVCNHFGVPFIDIHAMCRREGWRFGVPRAS